MKHVIEDLAAGFRIWDGPLTRDLVLHPGDFGLGHVLGKLMPDATTTMVCGFCSTGCGLKIHMKDGKAVNLSAETEYPVNLGMACPKGWEALTPLAASDRAMAATQHYALTPKSDLTLLYGIANILIASGWIKRDFIAAHTTGYAEFAEFVSRFTPDHVAAGTGIRVEEIWHLAQTIAKGKRVSFWWTIGVNQNHEATRTAQAIINLALITGNIGRPSTGANSITGQCNAMGSRLYANVTSLLGDHDFQNAEHRAKVARVLGIPDDRITTQPSLAYDQIVQGIEDGKIKGLWVIATNSSHSWIHQDRFNELLKKLDFLVVQEMYTTTEIAQRADLVLPAAGWAEKEGTLIQFRAAHRPREKSQPRSGTGARRFSHLPTHCALLGLRDDVHALVVAGGCIPTDEGTFQRSAVRQHGHRGLRAH